MYQKVKKSDVTPQSAVHDCMYCLLYHCGHLRFAQNVHYMCRIITTVNGDLLKPTALFGFGVNTVSVYCEVRIDC